MIGILRRTRNLLLLAAGLIGVQEVAVVLVAVSPTMGLSSGLSALGVYITFVLFFGSIVLQALELNLREKTSDPLLAWLYLHTLYWLPSALNGVLLFGVILYVLAGNR